MATLTYDQIKQLWIQNGGNPNAAPIIAAISLAESGGRTDAINDNARTGDYSVGLFQINYLGKLGPARTARYGSPQELIADPNRQAKAAIAISGNGSNFTPWTMYTNGTYKRFLASNNPLSAPLPSTPALPSLSSSAAAPGAAVVSSEGDLFKWHIPTTSSDIRLQRATARKVVGAAVMVSGAGLGIIGLVMITGSRVKLPGPVGIAQGAMNSAREGRQQEAMVKAKAEGRQRKATEQAEKRRSAANRAEAKQAVTERKQQNRAKQRQEDALQRIEARRVANASNRRTTARGGTAPGRAAQSRYRSARAEGERAADKAGPF